MSTTTALNLPFPSYTDGQKIYLQQTLDDEHKVFSILDAYLQPSSAISATIAAEEINKLYMTSPSPGPEDYYSSLSHLWETFVMVVDQIPWQHPSQDKLVALIKTLRDLPDPTAITVAYWDDGTTKLWADLPVLDHVLTDSLETHGIVIDDDSEEEKGSRIRDINFQAFAARLTIEGVWDVSRLAVYSIRDVLEEDPDFDVPGYDKVGPHLDTGIPVANVWISLAGKLIFGLCKVNGEGAARNDMPGGKHWKGSVGFSVERWEFWKQRLDEVAINDEASEETRGIAKKMKEMMIAAEA